MTSPVPAERERVLRPSELDDAIYELLGTLAGIDTHDTNLRDHDQAWKAVEAYERKIRGHERAALSAAGKPAAPEVKP